MNKLLSALQRLGIASLRELVGLGIDAEFVVMAARYRRIVRVRKGWFALHGTEPSVLAAWKIGGRLACVSALALQGLVDSDLTHLHVEVPAQASRFRVGQNQRVTFHWARRTLGGDRASVELGAALIQASRCLRRAGT